MSRAAGDAAERRAAEYLEKYFSYKVVARNYTCRFGEAIETLTYQKLKRIGLTARHFLMRHHLEQRECRFDVVMIQGADEPKLIKDAFRADF